MGLKETFNNAMKNKDLDYSKDNPDLMKNLHQNNNSEKSKLPFEPFKDVPRNRLPEIPGRPPVSSKPASKGIKIMKPLSVRRRRDISGRGT